MRDMPSCGTKTPTPAYRLSTRPGMPDLYFMTRARRAHDRRSRQTPLRTSRRWGNHGWPRSHRGGHQIPQVVASAGPGGHYLREVVASAGLVATTSRKLWPARPPVATTSPKETAHVVESAEGVGIAARVLGSRVRGASALPRARSARRRSAMTVVDLPRPPHTVVDLPTSRRRVAGVHRPTSWARHRRWPLWPRPGAARRAPPAAPTIRREPAPTYRASARSSQHGS